MNPFDALIADLAETLGNAALKLDADATARLADLEGRCIRIECALPERVATVKVQHSRIAVSAEAIGEADAVVQGTLAELIAWVAAGAAAESPTVRIEGDRETLAEVVAAIAPNLINPLSGALDRASRSLHEPSSVPGDHPFAGLRRSLDDALASGPGEDLLGALELAAAGLRSAAEGAAHAIERTLKSSPDGASPLAQLTPAFEALREGVLDLALKAQDLAQPNRGDSP